MNAQELTEKIKGDNALLILDVRMCKEYEAGHIEGALNIPLPMLEERLNEIAREKDVVVHCASGYRSVIATSILCKSGYEKVSDLIGGYDAWGG